MAQNIPNTVQLEAELGWSLHRINSAFRRLAPGAVADLPGGPRGYQVLVAVSEGLPPSQLALAHRLTIDKTAMTYLLDELEGAGLVERQPDPADRRARQILITKPGAKALTRSHRALSNVERQLFAELTDDEADQLRRLLTKVARSTEVAEACLGEPFSSTM